MTADKTKANDYLVGAKYAARDPLGSDKARNYALISIAESLRELVRGRVVELQTNPKPGRKHSSVISHLVPSSGNLATTVSYVPGRGLFVSDSSSEPDMCLGNDSEDAAKLAEFLLDRADDMRMEKK